MVMCGIAISQMNLQEFDWQLIFTDREIYDIFMNYHKSAIELYDV